MTRRGGGGRGRTLDISVLSKVLKVENLLADIRVSDPLLETFLSRNTFWWIFFLYHRFTCVHFVPLPELG